MADFGYGAQRFRNDAKGICARCDGRQKSLAYGDGKVPDAVPEKLECVLGGSGSLVKLGLHGSGIPGLVPDKVKGLVEVVHVLEKGSNGADGFLAEELREDGHLIFPGQGSNGSQNGLHCAFRILLHAFGKISGREPEFF